jgi:putative SOS response-associated peptidase YedK
MCGRYSMTLPLEAVRQWFPFRGAPNLAPRYNVAPTQEVPILIVRDGKTEVVMARWGLVPSWAKEIGVKPLINARAETVAERPAFRAAFRARRCLVPTDGFYEWQASEKGPKQPYRIRRPDGGLFAMAGIYEVWQPPEGGAPLISFAVLTTDANKTLAPIHTRMPVILDDADRELWLTAGEGDMAKLHALLRPAPDDALEAYPISTRVNRVANDDAEIWEPSEKKPKTKGAKKDPGQMSLL